jgi:hypothetical protein
MQDKERPIHIDTARKMIREHNGVLITDLSILPPLEVYDLDNKTVISIKVYRKEATLFLDREDALAQFQKMRPKGPFDDYQEELIGFPDNKDSILLELSKELKFDVDPKNCDSEYNERLSTAIEEYSLPKANKKLFLGLTVLLGETLRQKYGGTWEVETDEFLGKLQPFLRKADGQQETYFIKMLGDELRSGAPFSWDIVASFHL